MLGDNKIRRVKLQTEGDVRRYCAWLIKNLEAGNIEAGTAKTINSVMRTLLKAIELSELREMEARIAALEVGATEAAPTPTNYNPMPPMPPLPPNKRNIDDIDIFQ